MTQIFTDDGLCVPVTVIAVKDGNYVSAVRLSFLWNFIFSAAKRGTSAKMVAVCILRARILRARLVRGVIENHPKKNQFVRNEYFFSRMSNFPRARVRDIVFQSRCFERKGRFFLLLSPSCLKPSFFLSFLSFFFLFPLKKGQQQQQQLIILIKSSLIKK